MPLDLMAECFPWYSVHSYKLIALASKARLVNPNPPNPPFCGRTAVQLLEALNLV